MDQITLCSRCDYDLAGLPERSDCPECGQRFNRKTGLGVRRPGDPVDLGDRVVAWFKIGCVGPCGLLLGLIGAALIYRDSPWFGISVIVFGLFCLGPVWQGYRSLRRR